MSHKKVLERFINKAPFAVMTRLVAHAFIADQLDDVFEEYRERQYTRHVQFSAIATSVADVALNFSENFNQAYTAHREELGVSLASYYDKINATEAGVSEA